MAHGALYLMQFHIHVQMKIISAIKLLANDSVQMKKALQNTTSMQNSPVSGSLATVAVNPAADEDFPDV